MPMSIEHMNNLLATLRSEMQDFLDRYTPPSKGETLGTPWDKEKVRQEIREMESLIVEPFECEYFCDDSMIPEEERLTAGERMGFVVAIDGSYALIYDPLAEDYALIYEGSSGRWSSWGIRGDACSTFFAR